MRARFHLHWSPRVEQLATALCEVTRAPLSSPFAREAILVGSPGLDRWVTEQLARAHKVWANPWIVTPRRFVNELLGAMGLDESVSPAAVQWALADELRSAKGQVAQYLAGSAERRLELAGRLTELFERYAQHRPSVFESADWQAAFARRVEARFPGLTTHARLRALLEAIANSPQVPERVSVFGAPRLSPAAWDVLAALSQRVPVHVFLPAATATASEHALVQAMGEHVRLAFESLKQRGVAEVTHTPPAPLPPRATMLQRLQWEMSNNVPRGPAIVPSGRHPIAEGDRSIEIFSCHGPMREAETVRDRILAMFREDPGLRPRDVLILTPKLAEYAPYLDAAFSADEARDVPVHLADGGAPRPTAAGPALRTALQALRGRGEAAVIARLLGHPVVSARWGFDDDDRQTILGWLHELSVHWGADAEHRRAEPYVADGTGEVLGEENTWRVALDRLLLGVAVPSAGVRLVEGVLPYDDVEGGAAQLAGRFAAFVEGLLAMRPAFVGSHTPAQWAERFERLLEHLAPDEGKLGFEREIVRRRLNDLFDGAALAAVDEALSLEALLPWIESVTEEDARGAGFASGVLTVGALLPMRNVPFRVIALVGFGDDQFPRRAQVDSLDLLTRHPEPLDPSPRDEDRGAFLDAIGSARDRLLITYQGRDAQENAPMAPSVVVAELLDVIDATFEPRGGRPAREQVRHELPLSPWDARIFIAGGRVQSMSKTFEPAARASLADPVDPAPFFSTALADEPLESIDLGRLARTLGSPVERPLTDRLQIEPGRSGASLTSMDPCKIEGLERWLVNTRALELRTAGVSAIKVRRVLRATGKLPPGRPGDEALDAALFMAEQLLESVATECAGEALAPCAVDLEVRLGKQRVRVEGGLEHLFPGGRVTVRAGDLRLHERLDLWVHHVALCAVRPKGGKRRSVALGWNKEGPVRFELAPIDDAAERMASLVALYRRARAGTLPIFDGSMIEVARQVDPKPSPDNDRLVRDQLARALRSYTLENAYVRRVLRGADPTAADFKVPSDATGLTPIEAMRQLLLPMLAAEVA